MARKKLSVGIIHVSLYKPHKMIVDKINENQNATEIIRRLIEKYGQEYYPELFENNIK
jgi:hypothetical protein